MGTQGHLTRARHGRKQIHGGNNVLFDTLLRSGRKGNDSRRKDTNLSFMFDPFIHCSHPDFHPSVSASHHLGTRPLSPRVQAQFRVCLTLGVLRRDALARIKTCVCWEHGEQVVFSFFVLRNRLFSSSYHDITLFPMHSHLQLLGIQFQ